LEFRVCHVADLEENKPFAIEHKGIEVGVILSKGEIHVYENICPHAGGPVCLGDVFAKINQRLDVNQMAVDEYVDENELRLVCPWHGLEYDLKTGICNVDPNLKIRKHAAVIKDDHVYVEII
jgi:nitrite reductase/ring-hydroxylating ferredoxin subunit